jgi:hypothetical protein
VRGPAFKTSRRGALAGGLARGRARVGDGARRAATAVRAAVAAQSRRRRILWAVVAIVLVVVPFGLNIARQSTFEASTKVLPRAVGPFPAERSRAYYRSLLADPELLTQMKQNADATAGDFRNLRIVRRPARRTIELRFSDVDRERARDFVNALALQIANATSRELGADAQRRVAQLTLQAQRARRARRRSTAVRLRREAAGVRVITRAPPQRIVIGSFAPLPKLTHWADRVVDALPGALPPRPNPVIAALASLLTLIGLFVLSLFVFPPGGRRPRAAAATAGDGAPPAGAYAPAPARTGAPPPTAPPPDTAEPAAAEPPPSVWTGERSIWTSGRAFDDAVERTIGLDRRLAIALFAVLCLVAGAVLVLMGHGTFFWGDDWDMVLRRFGLSTDTLLTPHVNHLVATQVLFYEGVRGVAEWHYGAYRLGLVVLQLAIAVGVFAFARPRIGGWLAAGLVVPMLFIPGEATTVYTVGNVIAVLTGLAAILVLDRVRRGPGRDVAICVLLLLSIASFSFGLAFCAAVAIWLLATPGQRRSLWVPAIPVLAYVVWVISYDPPSPLSLHNLADTPEFVADSAAAAFAAVTGLGLGWGRLLALAAAVAVGYELFTKPRLRTPATYAIVALPILLWTAVGLGRAASGGTGAGRIAATDQLIQRFARLNDAVVAGQSRYVYPSVVLLLLVAAHLLAGRRVRARLGVVVVLLLAGVTTNLVIIRDTGATLRARADQVRARFAGVEMAKRTIAPGFGLGNFPGEPQRNLVYVANFQEPVFRAAVKRVGSEPVPLKDLRLSAVGRRDLDQVLVAALPATLGPAAKGTRPTSCVPVNPGAPPRKVAAVRTMIRAGRSSVQLLMRRFGPPTAFAGVATVPARGTYVLTVPRDRARRPWVMRLNGSTRVRVCAPAPAKPSSG